MAIWKEQTTVKKESTPLSLAPEPEAQSLQPQAESYVSHEPMRRNIERKNAESVIAAGLTIEGTISGNGDVRIAGQFHGDVNVQGSLTIEAGAKLVGGVRASTVVIDGELEGNIDAATRVELHSTGVLNGNLNTGSLTVAAGSRMRGQVEFGWNKDSNQRPDIGGEHGLAS